MASHRRSGSTLLLSAAALFSFAVPRACEPPAPTPPTPPATTPTVQVSAEAQRVVDLTNAERAKVGSAPVTIDARLVSAAQKHSWDMANVRSLSHSGSDGSGPKDRMVSAGYSGNWWAENVASGYPNADEVMTGWMNSSGHRTNLLNPRATHIGVSVEAASDGSLYWTMDLGSGA